MFDQTTIEAREVFAELKPDALQDLINEATESVRNDMRKTLSRAPKKEP